MLLSASDSSGNTSALVAAYGPAEVSVRKELPNRATLQVVFKPKVRNFFEYVE